MQYDEDEVLTDYVWNNYHELMTFSEKHWAKAARLRAKGGEVESPLLRKRLAELAGDCTVRSAHLYCRSIRERLLRDHASQITINRCPKCNRIVRTPQARQCFWCGNNWHAPVPIP